MPRPKGSKNVSTAAKANCATCGKLLPQHALKGIMRQLTEVSAELQKQAPDGATAEEARRFHRMRTISAREMIMMLVEDAALFCFGHEPAKRGPRKTSPGPDPSVPPGLEPARRRKRGTLAAVPDE